MNHLKRLLTLILCLCLSFNSAISVFANEEGDYSEDAESELTEYTLSDEDGIFEKIDVTELEFAQDFKAVKYLGEEARDVLLEEEYATVFEVEGGFIKPITLMNTEDGKVFKAAPGKEYVLMGDADPQGTNIVNNSEQVIIEDFGISIIYGAKDQDGKWVWDAKNPLADHRFSFQIVFTVSGWFEGETIKIRVPKSILNTANGGRGDYYDMSVPSKEEYEEAIANGESIDPDVNFYYYEDGDEIVFENFRDLSEGQTLYIQMSYLTSYTTYNYQDTNYEDLGKSDDFYAHVDVYYSYEGREEHAYGDSERIPVYINTTAEIQSTEKQAPSQFITSWDPSWGDDLKTAEDAAGDYYYLIWTVRSIIKEMPTQLYDFTLADTVSDPNLEIVGFKYYGESKYTANHVVHNQIVSGVRYDYVLTRVKRQFLIDNRHWSVTNYVTATVDPLGPVTPVDEDTIATGQARFAWDAPEYTGGVGGPGYFSTAKRADGWYRYQMARNAWPRVYFSNLGMVAGQYSRYDLEKLIEGREPKLGGLDYAVWYDAKIWPFTLQEGADNTDINNFGKSPVRTVLQDETLSMFDEFYEGETPDEIPLEAGDYQFDSIAYGYTVYDATFNQLTGDYTMIPVTYEEGDKIVFYGNFGDGYVEIASYDLYTKAKTFDTQYVEDFTVGSKQGTLRLKDGCIGYRAETILYDYYVQFATVPNVSLKNSDKVMNWLNDNGIEAMAVRNRHTAAMYAQTGRAWVEKASGSDVDTDYLRTMQQRSYIDKKITGVGHNAKLRMYTLSWKVAMKEEYTSGADKNSYVHQDSGVFYDLLPSGAELDRNSVVVQNENGYLPEGSYKVSTVTPYKDTQKTMLIVEISESGDYYNLYYDTLHSYDSIKDWGNDVYNPVAYQTGNQYISGMDSDHRYGYPDDAGFWAENYPNQEDEYYKYQEYMNDLDPDSDDERFIYAEAITDIAAITSGAAGVSKKVTNGNGMYSYDTTTTINGTYSYRLRYENAPSTISKNLIFYDNLENFVPEGAHRDWQGTLTGINLDQLIREKGIAPVVYLSTVNTPGLAFNETNIVLEGEGSIWTKWNGTTEELEAAHMIAIDMRKCAEVDPETGEQLDFVLGKGESVMVELFMRAPDSAVANEGRTYPETYNNIYISNSIMDEYGNVVTDGNLFHQDYTTVRFVVTGRLLIHKYSNKDGSDLKGIVFRLTGTSDYGTYIDWYPETDKYGIIDLTGIEKGKYVLSEYRVSEDWVLDTTTYNIEIDEHGQTLINGVPSYEIETGQFLALEIGNTPRIHNDVKIEKRALEKTAEELALIESIKNMSEGDLVDLYDETYVFVRLNEAGTRALLQNPETGENLWYSLEEDMNVLIDEVEFTLSGTSYYNNPIYMVGRTEGGKLVFKNVERGTYDLRETGIDETNYVIADKAWKVTIGEFGEVSIVGPQGEENNPFYTVEWKEETGEFTIYNQKRNHAINFWKLDEENKKPLTGAQFHLYGNSNYGTSVDVTLTSENGLVYYDKLEAGIYYLEETVPPVDGAIDYELITKTYVIHMDTRGNYTIENMEYIEEGEHEGEYVVYNKRRYDKTIKVIKKWEDDLSNDERPTPVVHLLTEEPNFEYGVKFIKEWNDLYYEDLRPDSLKAYLGTEDGTVIEETNGAWVKTNQGRTWTYYFTSEVPEGETYYVWEDQPQYYVSDAVDGKVKVVSKHAKITNSVLVATIDRVKWMASVNTTGANATETSPLRNAVSFTRNTSLSKEEVLAISNVMKVDDDTTAASIYVWFETTRAEPVTRGYWWSDGYIVYFPVDSSSLFYKCDKLQTLDLRDFNTEKAKTFAALFSGCKALTGLNLDGWNTSNVMKMNSMFSDCQSLPISGLVFTPDTSKVTDMGSMFMRCLKFTSLDLTSWDTRNVVDMSWMFDECKALTSLNVKSDSFNTSNVTDMSYMFQSCEKLPSVDLSGFDTAKVTDFSGMFMGDKALTSLNLTSFNTSSGTNMYAMFWMCEKMTSLTIDTNTFLTHNVTNFNSMFGKCKVLASLNLSGFRTPKVTNMGSMFYDCNALTQIGDISQWDTSKVQFFNDMFWQCFRLASVNVTNFKTQSAVTMARMFDHCVDLATVHFGPGWVTSNVTDMHEMFNRCYKFNSSFSVTGFDTSNVTNMSHMFSDMGNSGSLSVLDLSSFDTSKVNNMFAMFAGNYLNGTMNYTTIYVSDKWTLASIPEYNANDASTYVETGGYQKIPAGKYSRTAFMFLQCSRLPNFNEDQLIDGTHANYGDGGYLTYKDYTVPNSVNAVSPVANVTGIAGNASADLRAIPDNVVAQTSTWSLTEDGEVVFFEPNSSASSVLNSTTLSSYRTSVKSVRFETITSVQPGNLFSGYLNLESVDFTNAKVDPSTSNSLKNMFYNCASLKSVKFGDLFNTSQISDLNHAFYGCTSLESIDLSGLNLSSADNLAYMFTNCSSLKNVEFGNALANAHPTTLGFMFYNCYNLQSVDLSKINTSNVTVVGNMFNGCRALKEVDISSFDFTNVTTYDNMFYGCASLKKLDLSNVKPVAADASLNSMLSPLAALEYIALSPELAGHTKFSTTGLAGTDWYHRYAADGTFLNDEGPKTGSNIRAMGADAAGVWVKSTYKDYTEDEDGNREYISDNNGWVKEGDVWTYTFMVDDDEKEYWAYEEWIEGYVSNAMEPDYISNIVAGDTVNLFTITNRKDEIFGELEILKTVVGKTTDQEFNITVKLEGDKIGGVQNFGGIIFNNGVANLKIKDGQTISIKDIPVNTTYTVSETEPYGFTVTYEQETGTVLHDTVRLVKITNTYTIVREPVDIALHKTETGYFQQGGEYTFTVAFENLDPNETYAIVYDPANTEKVQSFTAGSTGNSVVTVVLSDNETATFKEIPQDSTYHITEAAGDYLSSYTVVDANGLNHIVKSGDQSAEENSELSTAVETADPGEAITVTFTNKITRYQNLKLRKVLASDNVGEDGGPQFDFTVEFKGLEPNKRYYTSSGAMNSDADGAATKSILLKGGEEIIFYDLPVTATYKITEAASPYTASFELTDANGVAIFVKEADSNTTMNQSLSTQEETIDEGEDVTVTFTNTRNERELEITKTVTGNMGNKFKGFEFTITLTDGDKAFSGEVRMWKNGIEDRAVFDENGTYTFTLKHGETIKFELPYGITYAIKENTGTTADYTVTVDGEEKDTVTGVLTEDTTHDYVNDRTVIVPTKVATGVTGGMIVIVALAILLVLRKKRELEEKFEE